MDAASIVVANPRHTDWSNIPVERLEEGIERQMIVGEKVMLCRLRFAPHVIRLF